VTIRAILTPWQEDAFREVCAVAGAVETHFHGWSKRVILTTDRVFLFPRDHTKVHLLDREAAALEALDDCAHVPKLIARRQDDRISPYPFLELARVAGSPFYEEVYEAAELSVVLDLMGQLGPAIAEWHERSTGDLAPILRTTVSRPRGILERALHDDPARLANEAAALLELPVNTGWIDAIAAVQSLSPVLAHGDVHGEQLMVDRNTLTGIIDWETASIDNPIRDFNFGEWGLGWYRAHERDFSSLREQLWTSYASARVTVPLPDWRAVHLFFSLIEAWHCTTSDREFAIERRPLALTNLVAATT
jgi:aminoglycoside phosphotransferase (APT) family kinase protein